MKRNNLILFVILIAITGGIFIVYNTKATPPPQTQSPKIQEEDVNSQNIAESPTLEDGKHFIILQKINAESTSITFDRAKIFFSGQDDDEIKKLGENPDELPSGYIIHKEDQIQYTLPMNKDVSINFSDTESDNPATTFKTISLDDFLQLVGNEQEHAYFYITVSNGVITDMYEQFVP